MPKVLYDEAPCKSLLNRVHGMWFKWSVNHYRGCVHSCHYCFARRYHAQLDLNPGGDFTGIIIVKTNAPEVIRLELSRPSWQREHVTIGTATDPYQPIDGKYKLTRGILKALRDYRTPTSLITKGTMIVRDADVLASLNRRAGATVCFSLTTLDRALWERLEPGTPPPRQRLRALERLVQVGVNAGVLMAPVVPNITDSYENMEEVAREAASHGARFFGAAPLRLQGGTKLHFMDRLDATYPHLSRHYRRMYPGAYAPNRYQGQIASLAAAMQQRHGFHQRSDAIAIQRPEAARQLQMAV
ncbi:MAG: radical SAM protein [Chloroflexi bacterium]|nr:radical SAM protein [Chloroflexota bacterium]